MKSHYDVIIVGGGAAGLMASYYFAKKTTKKVLIVESGRNYNKRPCPVDFGKACNGCGGICNVISGFGGSMHYGDGIKLSFYPSGRRLGELLGSKRFQSVSDEIEDIISIILGKKLNTKNNTSQEIYNYFLNNDLNIRNYPIATLSEEDLKLLIKGFYNLISYSSNVDIKFQNTVTNITKNKDVFHVFTDYKSETNEITSKNVIVATGRKGLDFPHMLDELSLYSNTPSSSYGVRFEMPYNYLEEIGNEFPDLKISKKLDKTCKIKTFCFCGGKGGGRIKFTKYNNLFEKEVITLDGHVLNNPKSNTSSANFGLLVQKPISENNHEWISSIMEDYQLLGEGRPIVQPYLEFKNKINTMSSLQDIINHISFIPSILDLKPAPLHKLFPDNTHVNLISNFENIMKSIINLKNCSTNFEILQKNILVVGLALEFLWDEQIIDENSMSIVKGCYLVGDIAGISQGIISAMAMGLIASKHIDLHT